MSIEKVSCKIGENEVIIETGKLARQTDGAVTVQCGETIILVTAVSARKAKEGQDFFPLSVEYKEKAAAAGQIPGGYFKREGRPTEKEILTCRMTDRPLRPMFPKGYLYDTQIIATLLSADGQVDSDILSMNGASAAVYISDIPFAQPVGSVRVGRIDGEFIANPSRDERQNSDLDLVYSGTKDEVIMIEGSANELTDEEFKQALHFAHENIQPIIQAQIELKKVAGKETREYDLVLPDKEVIAIMEECVNDKIEDAIYQKSKTDRAKSVNALKDLAKEKVLEKLPETSDFSINEGFELIQKQVFRKNILDNDKRADGRGIDEIRQLSAEINVIPRVHGSALFARGETQALSLATLAPLDQAQMLDSYTGGETSKRFILHYNFPPFSVNETGRVGGLNRREIGHGALAERSIEPMVPNEDDFPYAIRVASEIMESNGSTSMASVCSGSMALMNAGVPLKKAVAGISVGLVTKLKDDTNIDKYKTIMDIIGSEDFYGDMDFKLCGTDAGITGFQLDLKLPGLPIKILEEAIDKASNGRTEVLKVMNDKISTHGDLSPHAPRIESIKINPEKIGSIIGQGGKTIRAIQEESGAEISINDDGIVNIYAVNLDNLKIAVNRIEKLVEEIEVGKIYNGKVVSITNFGAFMEVLPGQDGLIHISELADFRVGKPEDIVQIGDEIYAKCIGVDDNGKVRMSRKEAMKDRGETDPDDVREAAMASAPAHNSRPRFNKGGGGGGNRRNNNRERERDRDSGYSKRPPRKRFK